MALAEARAAWQRTANRCLVQEDAKRAPKLACRPSATPSAQQTETEPTSTDNDQDIPTPCSLPINQTPSYSNMSPSSRWWLQMQPNYGYQKVLMDEQFTSSTESQNEIYQDPLNLEFKDDVGKIGDDCVFSCEVSKSASDVYFNSESSWIGAEKNIPWWRTADCEELALLVAQRSVDVLENCDLPRPQTTSHVKKDMGMNICYFSHDEISTSLLVRKPGIIAGRSHVNSDDSTEGSSIAGNSILKLRKSSEGNQDEKTCEMHAVEGDASRAQLLEALRHSQTRAREAEEVMRRACAEKEHVVKLILRQASQIFAYKQWIHLLQLENMYFQLRNSKSQSGSVASPIISPNWTTGGNRRMRKSWRKCSNRKRAKRVRDRCDVGRYAVVFAVGLGLVGAGLLLGWTIGWMLPTW